LGSVSADVGYNYLLDTALEYGINYSDWSNFGINWSSEEGQSFNIHHNVIDKVGYLAISTGGRGNIEKNFIRNATYLYNDGGAIAFDHVQPAPGGLTVKQNIILDCPGNLFGTGPDYHHYELMCSGIAFGDQKNSNTRVTENTVANATRAAVSIDESLMYLNGTSGAYGPNRGHEVDHNTFMGTNIGVTQGDWSTYRFHQVENTGLNCPSRENSPACFVSAYNNRVHDNLIYKTKSTDIYHYYLHVWSNGTGAKSSFYGTLGGVAGYSDNNTYVNPFGLTNGSWGRIHCDGGPDCGNNYISFSQWKTQWEHQDSHSIEKTGSGIAGLASPEERGIIYYNNTDQTRTIPTQKSCMYTLDGAAAGASITLPAFGSQILEQGTCSH